MILKVVEIATLSAILLTIVHVYKIVEMITLVTASIGTKMIAV